MLKRNLTSLSLALLLLLGATSQFACAKNSRSLAKLGYDLNVGINQGVRTTVNLKDQNVIFQGDDLGYRNFLKLLSNLQSNADELNKRLDQLAVLNGNSKTEILNFLDKLALDFAVARKVGTVKLPAEAVNAILIGQAALNGARLVVAQFDTGKPKAIKDIKYKPVPVEVN